jgi:para-aminobenzoate synthetase
VVGTGADERDEAVDAAVDAVIEAERGTRAGAVRATAVLLPRVLRAVQERADRPPAVVLLDGRSGSGKTTLCRYLARALRQGDVDVAVVHMDGIYPGWDGLEPAVRRLSDELLPALRAGRPVTYPTWRWSVSQPGPEVTVRPRDVVLVEGVGCASAAARAQADLVVWLEVPEAVRYERAMSRDGDAYRPHWQHWAEQEAAYVLREQPAGAASVVLGPEGRTPHH